MAYLSDTQRAEVRHKITKELSKMLETLNVTKADMRAAVDATDEWIDDNQASYKAALPEPAATELTNKQKVMLFLYVAMKRYDII